MLTLSQKKVLEFIKTYLAEHDHSPSISEIAKGIGIQSRGVTHRYVTALIKAGYICISPGKRRSIQLLKSSATQLPLWGRIAAGSPIEAISDNETLDIMKIFLGENRYALIVKGDSMIDEGIFDGDVVVCEYNESPPDGKIVVALIDNQEATLKKVKYLPNNQVSLIPANAKLMPMNYPLERVSFQGIFIGLLRFEGSK